MPSTLAAVDIPEDYGGKTNMRDQRGSNTSLTASSTYRSLVEVTDTEVTERHENQSLHQPAAITIQAQGDSQVNSVCNSSKESRSPSRRERRFACTHEGCDRIFPGAESLYEHSLNHTRQYYKCGSPHCQRIHRQDLGARHRESHTVRPVKREDNVRKQIFTKAIKEIDPEFLQSTAFGKASCPNSQSLPNAVTEMVSKIGQTFEDCFWDGMTPSYNAIPMFGDDEGYSGTPSFPMTNDFSTSLFSGFTPTMANNSLQAPYFTHDPMVHDYSPPPMPPQIPMAATSIFTSVEQVRHADLGYHKANVTLSDNAKPTASTRVPERRDIFQEEKKQANQVLREENIEDNSKRKVVTVKADFCSVSDPTNKRSQISNTSRRSEQASGSPTTSSWSPNSTPETTTGPPKLGKLPPTTETLRGIDQHVSPAKKCDEELVSSWLNDTEKAMVNSKGAREKDHQTTPNTASESFDTESESQSPMEYPDVKMDCAWNLCFFPRMKQEYISRILKSFDSAADRGPLLDPDDSPTPSQSSNGKSSDTSPQRMMGTGLKSSKRDRSGDPKNGKDMDGHDEKRRCTAQSLAKSRSGLVSLSFACPFVKRYPGRYQECYSHVLKDSSRVKQHLRVSKSHQLPIYCPRCSETFESDRLRDTHLRSTCASNPERVWEGITTEQRQQLNKRSQSSDTEEARWFKVWDILFAGVQHPSTPYIDISLAEELQMFREHLLSEGPAIWNQIVQARLPENLMEYSEELALLHESAFPELVAELCTRWNASRNSSQQGSGEIEVAPIPSLGETGLEGRLAVSGSDSAMGNSVYGTGKSDRGILHVNSDSNHPVPSLTPPWASIDSSNEPSMDQWIMMSFPLHQEEGSGTSNSVQGSDEFGSQLPQADHFQDVSYHSFQDPGYHAFRSDEFDDYSWLVD